MCCTNHGEVLYNPNTGECVWLGDKNSNGFILKNEN